MCYIRIITVDNKKNTRKTMVFILHRYDPEFIK